ncbi:MAG: porin [Desulfobacterales bacterium]|nr:porin [Desulfobacterales bacterium]
MKKFAVALLALTVAVFLAAPAMAEFSPYGSVRLGTFWKTHEPAAPGADTDSDLVMPFGNYSRFGGKFKTGDISGHVELGLKGAEDGNAVYQRLLYGKWDMGGGTTLLVGQDYCPYTHISAQVSPGFYDLENYFIGYGCLWNGRQPQIRLDTAGGLYAGLIRPQVPGKNAAGLQKGPSGATAGGDLDVTMPKICVGYKIKGEGMMLNVGIGYNTYKYKEGTFSESVTSQIIYLNGKMALGPADLKFSVHTGQNVGDFGISGRETAAVARVDAGGELENSTCMGYYVQAAFKVDPATITVGYGSTKSENDNWGTDADTQSSYFVNAKIPIAKTFFVVPEYSIYDGGDKYDGGEDDDYSYMGVLLQMNF